jgi:hypothetical protein
VISKGLSSKGTPRRSSASGTRRQWNLQDIREIQLHYLASIDEGRCTRYLSSSQQIALGREVHECPLNFIGQKLPLLDLDGFDDLRQAEYI